MTATEKQRALLARGYDLGPSGADGIAGAKSTSAMAAFQASRGLALDVGERTLAALAEPVAAATITAALLKAIAPGAKAEIVNAAAPAMAKSFPAYGLTSALRTAHFLAQVAHESDGFATTEEYASGKAYEGRKDLGNTEKGDGVRFKGRGLIQLTGRANYATFGKRIGVDLIASPTRAADPAISVLLALEYWKDRGLNALADRDDVEAITRRINGGTNGLAARKSYLVKAKAALAKAGVGEA
jgi:putative chitinase